MDINKIKVKRCNNKIVFVFCLVFVVMEQFLLAQGNPNVMTNQMEIETVSPRSKVGMIIDAAKTLFSLPTSTTRWPFMLKDAYQYGRNYFSPPNIDFRSGSDGGNAEEGAGEKVKDAVVKTMDDSKATVEGSAKSAAKFTEDAMDKTVKKLKNSFSKHQGEHEPEL